MIYFAHPVPAFSDWIQMVYLSALSLPSLSQKPHKQRDAFTTQRQLETSPPKTGILRKAGWLRILLPAHHLNTSSNHRPYSTFLHQSTTGHTFRVSRKPQKPHATRCAETCQFGLDTPALQRSRSAAMTCFLPRRSRLTNTRPLFSEE